MVEHLPLLVQRRLPSFVSLSHAKSEGVAYLRGGLGGYQLAVDCCKEASTARMVTMWYARAGVGHLEASACRRAFSPTSIFSRDRPTFEQNAGRGNEPEASALRGEGKRREEAQQRDDAAVADSVRARLLKCKNLAVLDVDTEGGKVVTEMNKHDKIYTPPQGLGRFGYDISTKF